MLARLTRTLPREGHVFEPKWDGFRCVAARSEHGIELWSRHGRPFTRYFPELAEALRAVPADRWSIDGEVLVRNDNRWDFAALMARLHPAAARVELLARSAPATFFVFDLLAVGDEDLCPQPFRERRARLEELMRDATAPLCLTPQTASVSQAERWLAKWRGGGIDGVMAKPVDGEYKPGQRAVLKVKLEKTADCVLGGFRAVADPQPVLTSLLLGLYDREGTLRHIGVAASFARARAAELWEQLRPLATPLEGHPWEHGFLLEGGALGRLKGSAGRWAPGMRQDWIPLSRELVCEVAYGQVDEGRFRHPARLRRFRPDRDPRSCSFDQLADGASTDPGR